MIYLRGTACSLLQNHNSRREPPEGFILVVHDIVEEGEDARPVVHLLLHLDAGAVASGVSGRRYLSPLPQSFIQASKCCRTDDGKADEDDLGGVRVPDVEVFGAVAIAVGAIEDHLQLVVGEDGGLIPVSKSWFRGRAGAEVFMSFRGLTRILCAGKIGCQ